MELTEMKVSGFDPDEVYARIKPNGDGVLLESDAFWQSVFSGQEVAHRQGESFGWLISSYYYAEDWENWEKHPGGDEYVYLLSGAIDVILDRDGKDEVWTLAAGKACLIPRGVWHRATVTTEATALHFTPGDGTEHKPYEPKNG